MTAQTGGGAGPHRSKRWTASNAVRAELMVKAISRAVLPVGYVGLFAQSELEYISETHILDCCLLVWHHSSSTRRGAFITMCPTPRYLFAPAPANCRPDQSDCWRVREHVQECGRHLLNNNSAHVPDHVRRVRQLDQHFVVHAQHDLRRQSAQRAIDPRHRNQHAFRGASLDDVVEAVIAPEAAALVLDEAGVVVDLIRVTGLPLPVPAPTEHGFDEAIPPALPLLL